LIRVVKTAALKPDFLFCPKCFHKYIEDPKREVKPFSLQRGETALCKGCGSHTELDRKMSELICFSCGRLEEVESEGPQFEVIKPKKKHFTTTRQTTD